jgi:hypothetical protein
LSNLVKNPPQPNPTRRKPPRKPVNGHANHSNFPVDRPGSPGSYLDHLRRTAGQKGQLLHYTHFDTKGGKWAFAASASQPGRNDQSRHSLGAISGFSSAPPQVGLEPRLPDCRIAAKVRFREVKTFVSVNTADTEPCPIGSLLQCGFPKADIAQRRRVNLMLNNAILQL